MQSKKSVYSDFYILFHNLLLSFAKFWILGKYNCGVFYIYIYIYILCFIYTYMCFIYIVIYYVLYIHIYTYYIYYVIYIYIYEEFLFCELHSATNTRCVLSTLHLQVSEL